MPPMRETVFLETFSTDPVERALAAKAARILSHPLLDRAERVALVRQVQQELLNHRRQRTQIHPAESPRRHRSKTRKTAPALNPIEARRREMGGAH